MIPRPPFSEVVRALSRPEAFPSPVDEVECIQTHISAVFLGGGTVFKVKKPRDLGFLDFTTPESRRHFCHEEVRLNRRLAPHVYEGVVPVVREGDGLRFSAEVLEDPGTSPSGEVVDWAVRMKRLPDRRSLEALLREGKAGRAEVEELAERIAAFHGEAERGPEIFRVGDWPTVAANDRENFEQLEPFVGETIGPSVHGRLARLAEAELARLRKLMEARARDGVPCDTHGDLRLGHVYLLPPGTPGASPGEGAPAPDGDGGSVGEVVVIDCIEFNERFRWADPVADVAFTVMELEFGDRWALARRFARRYFRAAGDPEGEALLPYYATYRDVVRGKVRSFQSVEEEVPAGEREAAARKATRHFLRALGRLSGPGERPALLLVMGLPGVGKSTLARDLAGGHGFRWLDTDRVRKELATKAWAGPERGGGDRDARDFAGGIYSEAWTERTYDACLARAREGLFDGGRVLVEGSFRREAHRRRFLELAGELGVPALLLHGVLDGAEVRRRLAGRVGGDSDADWRIHREMAARWEAASGDTARRVRRLSLTGDPGTVAARAASILAEEAIAEP